MFYNQLRGVIDMFIGSQTRTKIDIIIYLLIMLLVEGSVDSDEIKNKFNIKGKR